MVKMRGIMLMVLETLRYTVQLIRDVRVATCRATAIHNNGTTWLEQKPW